MQTATAVSSAALTQAISADQLADLIEESKITETLDLGFSFVHRATHPEHGRIILVSTAGEQHAVLTV